MFNKSVVVFSTILVIVLVFQNCSQQFEASRELSSDQQINLSVGDDHFTPQGDLFNTSARATYLNRVQMANLLISVFGDTVSNDIIERVGWAQAEFGSSFGVYNLVILGESCSSNRSNLYVCENRQIVYGVPDVVGGSAPREGRRNMACHIGVSSEEGLRHAFKKISNEATLTNPPKVTEENFKRAFQLFFRGKSYPGSTFSDALNITFQNVNDPKEAWEKVILSICLSPHWQVL